MFERPIALSPQPLSPLPPLPVFPHSSMNKKSLYRGGRTVHPSMFNLPLFIVDICTHLQHHLAWRILNERFYHY